MPPRPLPGPSVCLVVLGLRRQYQRCHSPTAGNVDHPLNPTGATKKANEAYRRCRERAWQILPAHQSTCVGSQQPRGKDVAATSLGMAMSILLELELTYDLGDCTPGGELAVRTSPSWSPHLASENHVVAVAGTPQGHSSRPSLTYCGRRASPPCAPHLAYSLVVLGDVAIQVLISV